MLSGIMHVDLFHLCVNLFALCSLGPASLRSLDGNLGAFWALTVASTVVGGLAAAARGSGAACGLSGALLGHTWHWAERNPSARLQLPLLPDSSLPAPHFVRLLALFDGLSLMSKRSAISHASHLGGSIVGFAAAQPATLRRFRAARAMCMVISQTLVQRLMTPATGKRY